MKRLAVVISVVLVALVGCTDAQRGKMYALGEPSLVTQFSGGEKIAEWCSTGKVSSEENSDGYYFVPQSDGDGEIIEISGDVRIQYNHPECQ